MFGFQLSAIGYRIWYDWLVTQLFAQIDQLQAHLEAGTRPVVEQARDLRELLTLRKELGFGSGRELERPLPWAYHLQHVLCGDWQPVEDAPIRCPYCGGTQVRRKSRQPRQHPPDGAPLPGSVARLAPRARSGGSPKGVTVTFTLANFS